MHVREENGEDFPLWILHSYNTLGMANNEVSVIQSGRAIDKKLNSTVAYDNSSLIVMYSRLFSANAYDH